MTASNAATALRLAADCFACGALLGLPSEIGEGRGHLAAALAELPALEHRPALSALVVEPDRYVIKAQSLALDQFDPPAKPKRKRKAAPATPKQEHSKPSAWRLAARTGRDEETYRPLRSAGGLNGNRGSN
jgi:hypothetical protein